MENSGFGCTRWSRIRAVLLLSQRDCPTRLSFWPAPIGLTGGSARRSSSHLWGGVQYLRMKDEYCWGVFLAKGGMDLVWAKSRFIFLFFGSRIAKLVFPLP